MPQDGLRPADDAQHAGAAGAFQGIAGRLAGVGFRFGSDAADLAAYARQHLGPLMDDDTAALAVTTSLRWHEGQPPTGRGQCHGMEQVDRDIYTDGCQLHWFRVDDLRDLFLRFQWAGERLTVDGQFYFRLGNSAVTDRLRRVRRWAQRGALRRRRFTTLLHYLVYYPCWWWLEHVADYHPIHAAAVAVDGDATLLVAGASGVGKSTLALALAASPQARLLSDSFVLHRGADVLAVPEPVPLDPDSLRWLGDAAQGLQPVPGDFGRRRRGFHVARERTTRRGRAVVLVFPRRSSESYVRPLTPAAAHQRLSAANLIINDLRRYWAFAAVLEHLVPDGLVARREAHLAQLAAAAQPYEVGVLPGVSRDTLVGQLRALLADAARAHPA